MFLGIFRGTTFLGNFRGPLSSEIPDANSEEDFVGTSEDWTIRNFLIIYRGSPPSVYSEELSDDLVVLGVSSEIQFLGIPSEIFEGFPGKNEFPRSYFRQIFSLFRRHTDDFFPQYVAVFLQCTGGGCHFGICSEEIPFPADEEGSRLTILTHSTISALMESKHLLMG